MQITHRGNKSNPHALAAPLTGQVLHAGNRFDDLHEVKLVDATAAGNSFVRGAVALPTVKGLVAVGCVLWYATAPFFIKGGSVQAGNSAGQKGVVMKCSSLTAAATTQYIQACSTRLRSAQGDVIPLRCRLRLAAGLHRRRLAGE